MEQSIERRLKKYAAWFGASVVLVAFGALVATIWQLNGAIYQAVGKQSESSLYSEILKMKIQDLEKENQQQKKMLSCFSNPQMKDKSGCSYGN